MQLFRSRHSAGYCSGKFGKVITHSQVEFESTAIFKNIFKCILRTQIAVFKIILGKVLLNSVVFIGISVGCKYYCLRKWQISSNGLKIYGIRSELENTKACNLIKKETLAQVLSCEFCEISKNMFFYRTPPVAASVRNKCLFCT